MALKVELKIKQKKNKTGEKWCTATSANKSVSSVNKTKETNQTEKRLEKASTRQKWRLIFHSANKTNVHVSWEKSAWSQNKRNMRLVY